MSPQAAKAAAIMSIRAKCRIRSYGFGRPTPSLHNAAIFVPRFIDFGHDPSLPVVPPSASGVMGAAYCFERIGAPLIGCEPPWLAPPGGTNADCPWRDPCIKPFW